VQTALRRAYFGRVRVAGTQPGPRRRPRLIVASHRNGALDGAIVLAAFPYAQHLVSLQLLRGPLRVLFTGIPVIRAKDVERYGMDRSQITDPVTAGVTHLRDGGDLVVFPEGTSEWRHAPGTHQRGAAKIWCRLQEEGIDVDVIPVGLFYAAPERYGSTAQPWVGPVLDLPRSTSGPRIEREKEAHRLITDALDAVSVHCPSPAVFDGVQRRAAARSRAGESFAAAVLEEQVAAVAVAAAGDGPSASGLTGAGNSVAEVPVPSPWPRRLGLLLHWPVWPVLGVAWAVGRKADARNTVSFFRVLGGAGATVVWGAVLLGAGITGIATGHGPATAVTAAAGTASLVAGRLLVTASRWQPDTAPLTDPPVHHRPASR
jgi:1-acyl-sn-glycerol-3-phosphate acyltransferase